MSKWIYLNKHLKYKKTDVIEEYNEVEPISLAKVKKYENQVHFAEATTKNTMILVHGC